MRTPAHIAVAVALATLPALARADASPSAPWSVTVQGWAGVQRYDVLGLTHTVSTNGGRDLLDDNVRALGISALLRIRWFEFGILYEGSVLREKTDSAILTPIFGVRTHLSDYVRLELLGELGSHQITNVGISDGVSAAEARTVWLPYAGLRPTISFSTPLGAVRAVFSAAPFLRWDLVGTTVSVEVGRVSTDVETYKVGGVTYGLSVGAGVEL